MVYSCFRKINSLILLIIMAMILASCQNQTSESESVNKEVDPNSPKSTVYMSDDISSESLVNVYNALGWTPTGNVAVKISTGEPPNSNYLRPELIKSLVDKVSGTIVEDNTAYGDSRSETEMHYQVAKDHG